MNIREIEKIIDVEHTKNPVFNAGKEQTFFDLLVSFEDSCGLILMSSILNPTALKIITDQMDSLNIGLLWADNLCLDNEEPLKTDISELRYTQCCDLLTNYANPYSVICSGYISYSRNRFTATVKDNIVTFNPNEQQNNSMFSDILRETSMNDFIKTASVINPYKLIKIIEEFKKNVKVENGSICYSLSEDIYDTFRDIAEKQWDISKTLPSDWKFDFFSLMEYKSFWVTITTLCYIHFCSCFAVEDPQVRLKNSVIIQSTSTIIENIAKESGLSKDKVKTMIDYITFNPKKKNMDIMYQPIIKLGEDILIIAPILFMGSRPERNLLSVVSTMHDKEYSREVNDLEGLMVAELESYISSPDIVKHKSLRDDLPDIDFAVLDKSTNSAMICETKWFAAADSTREVISKEDEITHGCKQVEKIMGYAMSDRKQFFKQVFNIDDGENIDLFGCVIAKHNIRTQHKYVPVIDLNRIKELLTKYSLNTVFHLIRNHEYEIQLPKEATLTHQSVKYAGFEFRIPAIAFGISEEEIDQSQFLEL